MAESESAARMPKPATASPAKVVVVEDSDAVRKSLTLLLRTRGYAVEAFSNGMELLSARTLPDADCYLIDFKMPRLNGVDLLRRLRDGGVLAPALMITGDLTLDLRARAMAAGFVNVIEKPPQRLALVDQIASAIDNGPIAAA